jgi:hypothetical protein
MIRHSSEYHRLVALVAFRSLRKHLTSFSGGQRPVFWDLYRVAAFRARPLGIVMNVVEIVDDQVMTHLGLYGNCQGMDPYAMHILKTSNHPLMIARRTWMREEALRQCLEAHAEQKEMSKEHAASVWNKKASIRKAAVIHPYFMEDLRRKHNGSFRDKDFFGYVKREEPAMFPKREAQ